MVISKLLLVLFAVLYVANNTFASSVHVFAPDYKGAKVMVYKLKDHLTESRQFITYTHVGEDGRFKLDLDYKKTDLLIMVVDYVVCEMIISPDQRYSIFIPPLQKEELRSFGETAKVELVLDNPNPLDINVLISNINYSVDSFMVANVAAIGSRNLKPKYLSYKEELLKKAAKYNNPYVQTHLKYRLADFEFSASISTPRVLFEDYLDTEIEWQHPSYTAFIRSFFQRYFAVFESKYGTGRVMEAVHDKENCGAKLISLLDEDEFLKNDTLKELVAIHALLEARYTGYVRQNLIECLQYIHSNGTTDFNRDIALNALTLITSVANGFAAYEFSLPDQHNETKSLSDFKGKYVYLEVLAPWCTDCRVEQTLLPSIISEYGNIVDVVSIVIGCNRSQYQAYVEENPWIDWPLLFDESDFEIKQAFEVNALPGYFLIDPEGKYYRASAKSPSQGIVEDLYPIAQKLKEAARPKVGDK
jgi:thiol-disulfide isomerase/thioredoxin